MMQSVGDTATGCQDAVTGLMFTWVPGGVHVYEARTTRGRSSRSTNTFAYASSLR
jgi:hypothetical protein